MKCVNTDWDEELIRRLNRGHRSAGKVDNSVSRRNRSISPAEASKTGGRWTLEQKLALKAARNAEKRLVTPSFPQNRKESDNVHFLDTPFWKIRIDLMESKNREAGRAWDTNSFRKKLKILDDAAGEMKQVLIPERKPHQELPSIKTMTKMLLPSEPNLLPTKAKPSKMNLEEILRKRLPPKEPNYVEFSSLSSTIWTDICKIQNGETIPLMMKSMKSQHWEKIIKYYGIFERVSRLDRGVLYELACDLDDNLVEHPSYRDLIKHLHPDPNEAVYLLGKLMMSIFHHIALQSGIGTSKHLTIQEITAKLDSGYKSIMKTKKEDDARMSKRVNFKTKIKDHNI